MPTSTTASPRSLPLLFAAMGAAVAWTLLAVWVTGNVTPNVFVHGATLAGVIVATLGGVWVGARGRRFQHIRLAAVMSVVATLVVVVAVGAWVSRPRSVDENIVTATADSGMGAEPGATASIGAAAGSNGSTGSSASAAKSGNRLVAEGEFSSLAHETSGTVRIIELEDGSAKLTLDDFNTDPGPDLFVYAVAGDPAGDGDVDDYVNLGSLKGTRGDQQYDLPDHFDPARHRHIYIWCRAFTVGFGRAELQP